MSSAREIADGLSENAIKALLRGKESVELVSRGLVKWGEGRTSLGNEVVRSILQEKQP